MCSSDLCASSSAIHPQELLAQTLNHMAERSKLDKGLVDDLAVGLGSPQGLGQLRDPGPHLREDRGRP